MAMQVLEVMCQVRRAAVQVDRTMLCSQEASASTLLNKVHMLPVLHSSYPNNIALQALVVYLQHQQHAAAQMSQIFLVSFSLPGPWLCVSAPVNTEHN